MKKTIIKLSYLLGLMWCLQVNAQITTQTFETFTLSVNGYYSDTLGTDWEDNQAVYQYDYDNSWKYWSGGLAYTNLADSTNGGYTNLYNCKAKTGYNNSSIYVTAQSGAMIKMKNTYTTVNGFYVTNTTYAYNSMRNGDSFAKKFGGSTGTDPDWFKLLVYGYRNGVMITDSVEFYLADFRFSNSAQDYLVKSWQWVDCTPLGWVDSISFELKSSDVGSFGMNTPAFFSLDNFTTQLTVGVNELSTISDVHLFPNPATDKIYLQFNQKNNERSVLNIFDIMGGLVKTEVLEPVSGWNNQTLDLSSLKSGIYFIEIKHGEYTEKIKIVKQ